ncbi:HoxN/HupN/NixA family nickel/cobalt transporter [Aeromicrobium sp.]|uniref:HoxN/HupN/NixA family nickel/cobalt transporter n=1 Tax=Aeromicrobium sp. TaxID=1871063 RepID=UPI003D6C3FB0
MTPQVVVGRISRPERRSLLGMTTTIVILHVVGWGALVVAATRDLELGSAGVFGVGLGITAYTLGMRHAFDADHIAAIDNVTRKFLADRPDGSRPMSVGFWFSLGHSSVVFGLCLLLALGVRSLGGQVQDESSTLQQTTGLIGISVSSVFLILIGVLNAVVLAGILRVFRDMRTGCYDEAQLEDYLQNRGLMNRILGRSTRAVSKPRHMYLVGFLFGLGFDTATEVSLLVLAAGVAASQLPWYAFLALPILFAAGMSLLDSMDGAFMAMAYGWAFVRPVRKVYYSITVTAMSVVVALLIGGIQIVGLLSERLDITSGAIGWIGALSLDDVGYAIVAVFVLTWILSLTIWRLGRIEDRWAPEIS